MKMPPHHTTMESAEPERAEKYERLFIDLTDTLTRGDPAQMEQVLAGALLITEQRQSHDLDQRVMVHLLSGATYLKTKRFENALTAYQQATQSARMAKRAGHPSGNKFVANGLLGQASVWFTQMDYVRAARCYRRAAAFAQAGHDAVLAAQAQRMRDECLMQLGLGEQEATGGP